MNQYAPTIQSEDVVTHNRAALLSIGLGKQEAAEFAARQFAALPAWLRRRIKATTRGRKQAEPRKIHPAAGELAFYVNKYNFPPMR